MTQKRSRGQRVYGLRRLTLEEAARLLDLSVGQLVEFILARVRPSEGQWSKWKRDVEQIPLEVLQLYLESTHPPPAPPGGGGGDQAPASPARGRLPLFLAAEKALPPDPPLER